jgi:hypothetical protein
MKDWIIQYVKTKDMFEKRLKDYKVKTDHIEFDFGKKKHVYLFQPELDDSIIEKARQYEYKSIVTEKTISNFNFLVDHFEVLSQFNHLIMVFVTADKKNKVLVNPKLHAMVADPATLELGLKALWDSN